LGADFREDDMSKRWMVLGVAVLAGWSLTSCRDGNLFGGLHERGTGSVADIMSDARSALARHEYNNAQSYYEAVLAQDPDNAEALYGAAVATMGAAGLDIGQLVANIVASQPLAAPSLPHVLAQGNVGGVSGVTSNDVNSILYRLDVDRLASRLTPVICHLNQIRIGHTDGAIPADDIGTLVNLAIAYVLRAVALPWQADLIDIRSTTGGGSLEVALLKTSGLTGAEEEAVKKSIRDVIRAYQALKAAAQALNLDSGNTLVDLQTDVNEAFSDFKAKVNAEAGLSAGLKSDINGLTPDSLLPGVDPEDNCR
jgi:hypothetical protein